MDALGIIVHEENNRIEYDANLAWKVCNAPTIDAEPIVHSRWLGNPLDGYYCKNCLEFCLYNFYEEQVVSKYCPHCGAKMDGEG